LDVLVKNVFSNFLPGWLMLNKSGKSPFLGQFCDELMIGMNNSHQIGRWKNQIEKGATFTSDMPSVDASGNVTVTSESSTFDRCTGVFAAPATRVDAPHATTPVYNWATNWGPKYLEVDLRDDPDQGRDAGRRARRLLQPELRRRHQDSLLRPRRPVRFHAGHRRHQRRAFAFPGDLLGTCGFGRHRHVAERRLQREQLRVELVQTDTAQSGKPKGSSKLAIDTVHDPKNPEFCSRDTKCPSSQACCLMVEDPDSGSFVGYANLPALTANCPSKDPMECCVLQNIANKPNPAVPDFSVSPPVAAHAHYAKNDVCKDCGDKLADLTAAASAIPFDVTAWQNAYKALYCGCYVPGDPQYDPLGYCEPTDDGRSVQRHRRSDFEGLLRGG
jgi:hypothetical protein